MIALFFPEALNQGHSTFSQVLRREFMFLYGCFFIGCMGYAAALVLLGFVTAFVRHLPFRIMHQASMSVGIGSAALLQLYRIPFVLHRPSDGTAISGICLASLAWAISIVIAVRIVLRNAGYHASRLA